MKTSERCGPHRSRSKWTDRGNQRSWSLAMADAQTLRGTTLDLLHKAKICKNASRRRWGCWCHSGLSRFGLYCGLHMVASWSLEVKGKGPKAGLEPLQQLPLCRVSWTLSASCVGRAATWARVARALPGNMIYTYVCSHTHTPWSTSNSFFYVFFSSGHSKWSGCGKGPHRESQKHRQNHGKPTKQIFKKQKDYILRLFGEGPKQKTKNSNKKKYFETPGWAFPIPMISRFFRFSPWRPFS